MGISIVSVVILLGVLIFAHELGHFLVAKKAGVGVLKFSLGFGPRLIGRKIGETEYLLSLIPLGGYVKLLGESADETLPPEEERRSFLKQRLPVRAAIVAAGPLFNLLLALLIFTGVSMVGMPVLTAEVGEVLPASAAAEAGMQKGDRIETLDGEAIVRWDQVSEIVSGSRGRSLKMTVRRGDARMEMAVTPKPLQTTNLFGEAVEGYKIGISPSGRTFLERQNPLDAFGTGLKQTWTISKLTVLSILKMIQGIVSPKTLGGPILIAQMAGAQVREGLVPFLLFMALLSINLAILNLLPIPVLDGGHLFFFLIEGVTGREVNLRWREMAQQVGFFLLVGLMIFVFLLDIGRLHLKIVHDLVRYFTG